MWSLGFHRVYELVHRRPDWVCERFFDDGAPAAPTSLESGLPLAELGCVAFSVSFEQDYVNLLQMLDRAGIPLRRAARGPPPPPILPRRSGAPLHPPPAAAVRRPFA